MENFVINLFSDQLSKIILDFHKSTINANFLSGKGSITNIKLNVDLINDFLNKPPHGTVPFLEFTEITLSELRVEVTSYTNLKKAPIVLVIEEIHAKAREPLEYHVDPAKNVAHKNKLAAAKKKKNDALSSSQKQKNKSDAPQPYGLLHRILDNLSVKIKHIYLSFSSLGKLKTRRSGIWKPPTLNVCFDNVEWICVTETGNAGTPDMVWAHNELAFQRDRSFNQQNRHRSCTIYKKLSMLCHVQLLPSGVKGDDTQKGKKNVPQSPESQTTTTTSNNLLTNTQVDVYLAYVRRLRDASITGADLDVIVHNVDINLDVASYNNKKPSATSSGCDLGAFVHMLVGLLHCYYKDRSFVDPFFPDGVHSTDEEALLKGFNSLMREKSNEAKDDVVEEEAGPDDFLPEVAMMEDEFESSDESDYEEEPEDEQDEAYLAWKKTQDQEEGKTGINENTRAEEGKNGELPVVVGKENDLKIPTKSQEQIGHDVKSSKSKDGEEEKIPTESKSYKRKRKAVVVVASGAQKFEKLSFSLSIPRINMKVCLPYKTETKTELHPTDEDNTISDKAGYLPMEKNHHCIELLLEGVVAECIWPKSESGEMGGHVQGSIKYFHLIDSVYQKSWGSDAGIDGPKPWNVTKIFPLLRIGTRLFQGHDAFTLTPHLTPMDSNIDNFSKCDEFPFMADRQLTWRRGGQSNGPRALAFKSTISFVDETLTQWSKTRVVHECSLGKLDIVMDSRPFGRVTNIFSHPLNQSNLWFDERWLSGKWHEEIDPSIIAGEFYLKDHLQPLPTLSPTGNKQSALSSELRSITAHFDTITVRLPNPMEDLSSFRMADVIFSISEGTILVSSDLPSSFLSGGINAENNSHEYPHDPSDISCIAEDQSPAKTSDQITKFRMQISLTNCSLKIMSVQAYSMNQDELGFSNLLAPTNVTMMMSLENENASPKPTKTETSIDVASQSLILSVLVHQVESNIELRSLLGAFETLKYHATSIIQEDIHSSNVDELILSKSTSVEEDNGASNAFSTICIHVPELEVNLWGEQAHGARPFKTNQTATSETELKHMLLFRMKASQFEFGMEFMKLQSPIENQTSGAVYKCGLQSVSIEICSRKEGDDMLELLSMGGNKTSCSAHLIERVCAFSFPDAKVLNRGFVLRSEMESAENVPSTSANAVEIASPLIVDLNISTIEFFLNLVVECLLAPVFVGPQSQVSQIGQTPLGSSLWATASKTVSIFSSLRTKQIAAGNIVAGSNSLFRLSLHRLLVLVPSTGESGGHDSFGLLFSDVLAAGGDSLHTDLDAPSSYRRIAEKHCGYDGQTWLFHLAKGMTPSKTFYALRSKHSLLGIGYPENISIVIPESNINWSLPIGLDGSSSAPPFEVFAMKDLGMSLMVGAYPLSSLYFKLYKLSPQNASAQSEFSSAATRLHNSIGSYHCKMHDIMVQMNAEVDRLRNAVFCKENERVGALALASSTAAGWVRVGEDFSFSHRIFSSATFYKYWMVLDRSLLILYNAPGGTSPSFVIPLCRASTELSSLSMSSSSNKTASGIVGNHVSQKGFSVIDSKEGTKLFFVTANDVDYRMWTTAISMALKKEETSSPDIISTPNTHDDDKEIIVTDLVDPTASSMTQVSDPFEVIREAPTASAPAQAPHHDVSSHEKTATSTDPLGLSDVQPPPVTQDITQEEISQVPVDSLNDSDTMDDEEMEDISLCDSVKVSNDLSTITENVRSMDVPLHVPTPPTPSLPNQEPPTPPAQSSRNQEPQNLVQSLPMRERLALAKGKSKMASSKFGSALKAASESGRASMKQAPRKDETKRSFAVGQKMSMLKRNANTKLTAARSSMQDQLHVRIEDSSERSAKTAPSISSRDELSGNRKLDVGQKMSSLKKNASTKLTSLNTSVRSSVQDQSSKSVNTEDSSGPPNFSISSSQDELSVSRSGKPDIRKKIANLDQSMSNTMKRLKIDEKMTQLSAAVKSGVKNDPAMAPVMRKLASRNSEHPRRRLGIGEESKAMKPIKFNARETFFASSELPVKIKSISSGDALLVDDDISGKIDSLKKIDGSWVVAVDAIKFDDAKLSNTEIANDHVLAKPPSDDRVKTKWKYRITASDAFCGTDVESQSLVERSLSEVLSFHTKISEIITKKLPSMVEIVSQKEFRHADTGSSVFKKLSPIERLRVSGSILQRVTEIDPRSVSSCSLIKVFLSTLLECHMPEEAIMTTKIFLGMDKPQSEVPKDHGVNLTSGTQSVVEAFDLVSNITTLEKQPVSPQSTSRSVDPRCEQNYSSLLTVIMEGYAKAMKERDEALASLATTTIVNDNRIMQERFAKSNKNMNKESPKKKSSDEEDMLTLCKQLGSEIELRTKAESEINRLNERLEFERKIAEAKENELRRSFAPPDTATDSDQHQCVTNQGLQQSNPAV